jgi:hypothetical protein
MVKTIVTPKRDTRKSGAAKLEQLKNAEPVTTLTKRNYAENGTSAAIARQATHTGLDSLDVNDFKMPYLVLLQAKSAQVEQNDENPGEYWHSTANATIGDKFEASICNVTKKAVLWAPRFMNVGILAISHDNVFWDKPNQTFEVQFEKGGKKYKWHTGRNVAESGLLNFGSSQPENAQSKPAASLTYVYALYLHEHPELSPAVFSLQRSQVSSARILNSMLSLTRRPIWDSIIEFRSTSRTSSGNTYHNNVFMHTGFTNEKEDEVRTAIERIVRMNWGEIGRQQMSQIEETERDTGDKIPY